MLGLYAFEVEREVRSWQDQLSDRDFGRADFLVGLLSAPPISASRTPGTWAARSAN